MQLVKDGVIASSPDPALLRLKKNPKRYVPDVMYQRKNEYGREVIEKADPTLPSEFFIVRVRFFSPISNLIILSLKK